MEKLETPSFAKLVKEESAKAPRSDEEKRAFLSAFARMNGYLRLKGQESGLELSSEHSVIAKVAYEYLHDLYGAKMHFSYTRSAGFLKRIVYHVNVDYGAEDILSDLEIDYFMPALPEKVIKTAEQKAAFLAGAFLAGGSVNSPESSNYHLEISAKEEGFARFLLKLLQKFPSHPFEAKLLLRRGKYVVYIKRGDAISDFLVLIGARENCLRFEDVRVGREFASIGNRLENLDGANYRKSQKAGERQIEAIRYFKDRGALEAFGNPKLVALMELRLKKPDASLTELAELLSEELNTTVSRSNVNHLLREVERRYEERTNKR